MKYIDKLSQSFGNHGCIVTSGKGAEAGGMTANWGLVGVMWGKEVIEVPIRLSRKTHELVNGCGVFCVNVPKDPAAYRSTLAFFGSKSGRDMNKFDACDIKPIPCKEISTVCLPDCYVFECRVEAQSLLSSVNMRGKSAAKWYEGANGGNFHDMFIGEVVCVYET